MAKVEHVKSINVADGTITSFLQPSDWNLTHNITALDALIISGNTSGTTASISSGSFILAGGSNITLSQDSNTIAIVGANQSLQPIGTVSLSVSGGSLVTGTSPSLVLSAGNNISLQQTTGVNGAMTVGISNAFVQSAVGSLNGSSGTLTISGGNNITVGNNLGTITISAFNQSVQPIGSASFSVSGLSQITGTSPQVIFSAGNNITLAQTTAANGIMTLGISAFNQSVQPEGINSFSVSGGSLLTGTAQQVVFSAGNNITLNQTTNGSNMTIGISGPNTAAQTTQGMSFALTTTAGGGTAGSTTAQSATVVFYAGNNITLSGSGGSAIIFSGASVPSSSNQILGVASAGSVGTNASRYALADHQHAGIAGLGISGGNTSGNSSGTTIGSLLLAGGNNITLSQVSGAGGATITIFAPTFSNSGNVSFGVNAGTMTANAQMNMAISTTAGGGTAGTTTAISSQMTWYAGNNITISGSDGNKFIISGASVPSSSNQILGVASANSVGTNASRYALADHQHVGIAGFGISGGNTSGNSSGTTVGSLLFAGGNNITLSQVSGAGGATITVSAPTFSNSGNVSFGINAGTMTANAQMNLAISTTAGGGTAGTTTAISSQISFYAGNNITISGSDGNKFIFSGASIPSSSAQVLDVTSASSQGTNASRYALADHQHRGVGVVAIASNTTGTSNNIYGNLTLAGGNNITLSMHSLSTNYISIVGGAGGAAGTNTFSVDGFSAITGTGQQVVFSAGANITLGMTTAGSNLTMGITGGAGGAAGTASFSVSGLSQITGTSPQVVFSAQNNITLNQTTAINGVMTLGVSGPNTAAQTTQAMSFALTTTAGGGTAGSTTAQSATVVLYAGNNITLSGSGGSAIIISGPNTFASSFVQALDGSSGSVTLVAGNYMSISNNASTINIIGLLSTSAQVLGVASNSSAGTNSSRFAMADHQHIGVAGFGISGGNTSGNSSNTTVGSLLLAGGNNITLSQVSGAGGATITISAPTFSNSGNVSFGINAGTMTANAQMNMAISTTAGGGTAGTTTAISSQISWYAGNNITLSGSDGNKFIISGASIPSSSNQILGVASANTVGTNASRYALADHQHIGVAGFGISGGNTSGNSSNTTVGSLLLAGGNNITLSQVSGAGGATVTVSAPSYSNSGNVSFGLNAGTLTANAQMNMAISTTAGGGTAGTTTAISSQITFYAGNNITISGSDGNKFIISGPNTVAQSAEPRVVSLNGTSGSLSLSGASNITVSALNGSTITIYGPANILNSWSVGGNIGTTGSSNITGGGWVLAGGNNITLSQSNNTISVVGGGGGAGTNTFSVSGSSSVTGTAQQIVFSGGANITLNQTTGAAGAMTMAIVGAAGAAGGTGTIAAYGTSINGSSTQTYSTAINASNMLLALSAVSNMSFATTTGASSITVGLKATGVQTMVNVKDFGATGDSSTDDTTAITNAIAHALSLPGGGIGVRGVCVFFPQGIYKTTSAITILGSNITLVGEGRGSTVIYPTHTTGDVFHFGNGSTTYAEVGLREIQIFAPSARTSGSHIYIDNCDDVRIQGFAMNNPVIGITVTGASLKVTIDDGHIDATLATTGHGIQVDNGLGGDTYISNIVMSNSPGSKPASGINIISTGHLSIFRCNITSCVVGLLCNPTGTKTINYLFIDHSLFDSCGTGAHFTPSGAATAVIKSTVCSNSWFSGSTVDNGIEFTTATSAVNDGFVFNACRILNNYQHGIIINDTGTTNVNFTACVISGNGQQTVNTYDGINLAATALSSISIYGCRICPSGTGSNQQRYAIYVAGGASTELKILNNDVTPNGTISTTTPYQYIHINSVLTGTGNEIGSPVMQMRWYPDSGPVGLVLNSTIASGTSGLGGNSTLYFQPVILRAFLSANKLVLPVVIGSTSQSGNNTGTGAITLSFCVYSRGFSSNSTRMESLLSRSAYLAWSLSSNSNVSFTYPVLTFSNSTGGSTAQYAQNNASASQWYSSVIAGGRYWVFPISSTFTPGEYFIGFAKQSTTSGTVCGISNLTMVGMSGSGMGGGFAHMDRTSSATGAGMPLPLGFGSFSAQSAAWPATIAMSSGIRANSNAQFVPYFEIDGYNTTIADY